MGHEIINDPATIKEREESKDGFATVDIPLLKTLRVLKVEKGQLQVNKKLAPTIKDIQDFLQWTTGNRKPPLPPIARRILCLKRAIIKNSVSYVQTGNLQRTGENKQLEEIDALLRADGVKNLDTVDKCSTENTTFVGGVPANTAPIVEATPMAAPACGTTINCDNAAVVALLQDVKTAVDELKDKEPNPVDNSEEFTKVIGMKNQYINKLLDILKDNKINAPPAPNANGVLANETNTNGTANEPKENGTAANENKTNGAANELKNNGAADENKTNGATNEKQENGAANEKKENGAANEKKTNGAANELKNNGAGNEKKTNGAANEKKENGAANEKQENGAANEKQENGTANEKKENGAANELKNNGAANEKKENGASNEKTENGTSNEKKTNGVANEKKEEITVNKTETPTPKRLVLKNNNTYEPTLPSYKFDPNNNGRTNISLPESVRRKTKKNKKANSVPTRRERIVLNNNSTFEQKNPSYNFSSTNSPRSSMDPVSVRRSPGYVAESEQDEPYRTPGFEAVTNNRPLPPAPVESNADNNASIYTSRTEVSNNTARSAFRPEPVKKTKKNKANKQKSKRSTRKA